ncbi:Hypothetical protein D9617_71g039850 [Elsinoe fawcettii]|nr:Hypothetical protein D9617_71g039850 [Elsinoe fawcettii]
MTSTRRTVYINTARIGSMWPFDDPPPPIEMQGATNLKTSRDDVVLSTAWLEFECTNPEFVLLCDGIFEMTSFKDKTGEVHRPSRGENLVLRCFDYPDCAALRPSDKRFAILLHDETSFSVEEVEHVETWTPENQRKACHEVKWIRNLLQTTGLRIPKGIAIWLDSAEAGPLELQRSIAFSVKMLEQWQFISRNGLDLARLPRVSLDHPPLGDTISGRVGGMRLEAI